MNFLGWLFPSNLPAAFGNVKPISVGIFEFVFCRGDAFGRRFDLNLGIKHHHPIFRRFQIFDLKTEMVDTDAARALYQRNVNVPV
jgi:hypothetical protein